MANTSLLFLLLVPFILSGISILLVPKLSKGEIETKHAVLLGGIGLLISAMILCSAFFLGKGFQTQDEEVWNGRITSKDRKHDDYLESFSCNCKTDSKGNSSCETCYRQHYTVKWYARSTIGAFRIKVLDETDDSVYDAPDPAFYKTIRIGEACSKTNMYTNYIKAVPSSLMHFDVKAIEQNFVGMLPPYPIQLHSRWKIDRVVPVKVNVPDIDKWNAKLADGLKDLGNAKQVNGVIVLVNTADESYAFALQSAWLNGKKNDVILIVGTTEFPQKAQWVKVLSFAKDELFTVKLEDAVRDLPELTADAVVGTLMKNIELYYQRKPMAEFKYLDDEIVPPDWVLAVALSLVIAAYLGCWFAVHKNALPAFVRPRQRFGNRRYPF